jgi:hypothetical protein
VTALTRKNYYQRMIKLSEVKIITRREADAMLGISSYNVLADGVELGHIRSNGKKNPFEILKPKKFFEQELARLKADKAKPEGANWRYYWIPWALGYEAHDPFNLVSANTAAEGAL